MKPILLILGGQIPAHNYAATTQVLTEVLEKGGFTVRHATDAGAGDLADASAVVLFTDGDFFPDDAIARLKAFVEKGGGLVTLHTAANTNIANPDIGPLVGSRVQGGVVEKHTAHIVDSGHPITQGVSDFELDDEIHDLKPLAEYRTLIDAEMNGARQPLAYVKQTGQGRTVHLATGHAIAGVSNPQWQEIFRRAVNFVSG